MRTAFINTLYELAEADPSIWLITADLGFSVLETFRERFPDRFVNIGVAEQNMASIAAGLAMTGKHPFLYSIANFPTLRCLEQVRNDIGYHGCRVTIAAVGGGYAYGEHGYSHHGVEDLAIMRALPGMTVLAPGDPIEVRALTRSVATLSGPSYIRLGKAGEPIIHAEDAPIHLGQAAQLRDGRDLTVISTGAMLASCMAAARRLAGDGIETRVLSMHTLKPFDAVSVLAAVQETGALVTVEEHSIIGGLGSAVAETLLDHGVAAPKVRRMAIPDAIHPQVAGQEGMRAVIGDIRATCLAVLGRT